MSSRSDWKPNVQLTPSIYEHAAQLVGETPWRVSRDSELLRRGHAEAYRLYHHTPIVVGIDIYNLEAEAYGAVVQEPAGNGIPAICAHPCASIDDILALSPFDPAEAGRIPLMMEVALRLQRELPEADIRIPLAGPFSIAVNLLGLTNTLMLAATDPVGLRRCLQHLADGQVTFCEAVIRRGLDIAFFESAAAPPLLSPDAFCEIELPPLKDIMRRTAGLAGHAIPCIIGGDTEPILDHMLATGTSYLICPTETAQARFMARVWDREDVHIRVNISPEVMSNGSWPEVRDELDRALALVEDRPNVCLGTGALPYETSPDLVIRAIEYAQRSTTT